MKTQLNSSDCMGCELQRCVSQQFELFRFESNAGTELSAIFLPSVRELRSQHAAYLFALFLDSAKTDHPPADAKD